MGQDIIGLHHVGHLVQDMPTVVDTYRRLGFTLPPPAYPALPTAPGQPTRALGAANTHIYLRRNFIEIVSVIDDGQPLPDDAQVIPLNVPDDKLPGVLAAVRGTVANLVACLDRFEGVHILMLDSPDIDRAAARLRTAGVGHGGVHLVQRPVDTVEGTRTESVRYLEIDSDEPGATRGRLPEGRVGLAENHAGDTHQRPAHANGAVDLVECLLCVPDAALPGFQRRYETYLGRPAEPCGPTRSVFHLDDATVTVVAASALPDERPPALPAIVGYTVSVHDTAQTEQHLQAAEVPHHKSPTGEIVVPASEAHGVAITFRATTS
jgi:hypothetical protein